MPVTTRRVMKILLPWLLIAAGGPLLASQDTAVVAGIVLGADTGLPIPGALVRVIINGGQARRGGPPTPGQPNPFNQTMRSGPDGRFRFERVPAGRMTLRASANGYEYAEYNPGSPSVRPTLAPGQVLDGAVLRLEPRGSIAGTVRNERGEPMAGVAVALFDRALLANQLVYGRTQSVWFTDDEGRYRMDGIFAGEFLVGVPVLATTTAQAVLEAYGATPPGSLAGPGMKIREAIEEFRRIPLLHQIGTSLGSHILTVTNNAAPREMPLPVRDDGSAVMYRTTYHLAATTMDAATIVTLANGQDVTGIDVTMTSVRVSTVRGHLTGPADAVAFMPVYLVPAGIPEWGNDEDVIVAVTLTDGTGAFTLFSVPAGEYTLKSSIGYVSPLDPAPPESGTGLRWWAQKDVTVGGSDLDAGAIELRRPLAISGEIVIEGRTDPRRGGGPPPSALRAQPVASLGRGRPTPVEDLRFRLTGLRPGRYHVMGADNRYWMVQSITGGGQDLTGGFLTLTDADMTGLVVTLTNQRTMISGTVVDADGRPVPRATVLLFPADHEGWVARGGSLRTMRRVRADESGRYTADGFPAGDYLLAAYPDGQPDEWPDPRVMAVAAAVATPVTIAVGETRTVDLTARR